MNYQKNNCAFNEVLVSVITPVFNALPFLDRIVASVRSQKVTYEHIFIDDCSTDGSSQYLINLSITDPNVRVIFNQINVGPAASRNSAISISRGRFIAFLDADDYWLPDKLSIQSNFMLANKCAISYTDYRFVSENGLYIGWLVKGPNKINHNKHYISRSGLGCLTVMIDLKNIPNFEFISTVPIVDRAEDFYAWLKVLEQVDFAYRVPFDLARYSVVHNSRSSKPFYKLKTLFIIYYRVEKMSLIVATLRIILFAMAASLKRFLCKPRFPISIIDSGNPPLFKGTQK